MEQDDGLDDVINFLNNNDIPSKSIKQQRYTKNKSEEE